MGIAVLFTILCLLAQPCLARSIHSPCPVGEAIVSGYAQAFVDDVPLADGEIRIFTDNKMPYTITKTDRRGNFRFCWPINRSLSLVFVKKGYMATQSPLFKLTAQGLQGPFHEVTFQVPRKPIYKMLEYLLKIQRVVGIDAKSCQVATTITAYHKTLQDDPQGFEGARIRISHLGRLVNLSTRPYYFGIFFNKTFPLSPRRHVTSEDGGVVVFNLPTSKKPYTISAEKSGVRFSRERFFCRSGAFINLSPPHSPMQLIDSINYSH